MSVCVCGYIPSSLIYTSFLMVVLGGIDGGAVERGRKILEGNNLFRGKN